MATKSHRIHQMTVPQWEAAFPDDDACKAYLVRHRWPTGVRCPRCGNEGVSEHGKLPFHWQCSKCSPTATSYRFSVLVGTIFENTNVGLRMWFRVIHTMITSKKGVSALQIHRTMGFGSYRTAWYMCHRIRAGFADEKFCKLMGIVEVDESYIGGKAFNKHGGHSGTGGGMKDKFAIVGAVERGGNVVARVLGKANRVNVQAFVREMVSTKVSCLSTDESPFYRSLPDYPTHAAVNHGMHQYVVGALHTNTIEGFWSLIKRGVVGTYHKVSRKYLPLYVAEFQFRYNNRLNADIFGAAIQSF